LDHNHKLLKPDNNSGLESDHYPKAIPKMTPTEQINYSHKIQREGLREEKLIKKHSEIKKTQFEQTIDCRWLRPPFLSQSGLHRCGVHKNTCKSLD
jgi:hypothetical protein